MKAIKSVLLTLLVLVLVTALAGLAYVGVSKVRSDQRQKALASFYEAPDPLPAGSPGDLLRSEPLTGDFNVPDATAYRILYRSEDPDGSPRVSSGMVFVPAAPAPADGRPIISWAHPTLGMGEECAPSRAESPTALMDWLPAMVKAGWLVTATDYAGLGTAGTEYYLIGQAEARDAINAVRAAKQLPGNGGGDRYGVYGHSQGGHSAMWAGTIGKEYAPELQLVGVAGAAPAAPLTELVDELWDSPVAWVIGAEVFRSYPAQYPGLDPAAVGTKAALGGYQELSDQCLKEGILDGTVRSQFGEQFFSRNPNSDPAWAAAIAEQTAKPLPPELPVLVTESVNDGVVEPPAIAAMEQQWCAAGSTIDVRWLGPLRGDEFTPDVMSHMYEGSIGGALATTWFQDRFAGKPAARSCGQTPPLTLTSNNPTE